MYKSTLAEIAYDISFFGRVPSNPGINHCFFPLMNREGSFEQELGNGTCAKNSFVQNKPG